MDYQKSEETKMKHEFKTIGKVEQHFFAYLERVVPQESFERMKAFMAKNNIAESAIMFMLVNENDNEKLFTMRIKGLKKDLYYRIKKEG